MKGICRNNLVALIVAFSTLVGSVVPVSASQEISGIEMQSADVHITAEIYSVYSVALPASIELESAVVTSSDGTEMDGYWYKLQYGVAGKISNSEKIYVKPTYPCEMTVVKDGEVVASTFLWDLNGYGNEQSLNGTCKTEWTSLEVGTCDFDGVTVSNCSYSNCCESGHYIGIKYEDIAEYGTYEGNLVFEFGIQK